MVLWGFCDTPAETSVCGAHFGVWPSPLGTSPRSAVLTSTPTFWLLKACSQPGGGLHLPWTIPSPWPGLSVPITTAPTSILRGGSSEKGLLHDGLEVTGLGEGSDTGPGVGID